MEVIKKLTLDLAAMETVPPISAVQGDGCTRVLELTLTENQAPWNIPEGTDVIIYYTKPDGEGGICDSLPDGSKAWRVAGNILTVTLPAQVCSVAGITMVQITLSDQSSQLSTATIPLVVNGHLEPQGESQNYINLAAWLQENGTSPYDIAVANGYKGTEAQWLESLRPQNGVDYNTPEEKDALAKAVHHLLQGDIEAINACTDRLPQFRMVHDSELFQRLTSHLVEDGFYSITASLWDDLPCGHCTILVLRYSTNYIIQIAIEQEQGYIYTRIIHRETYKIYKDWTRSDAALKAYVDGLPAFRFLSDLEPYNRQTSTIVTPGYYSLIGSQWDDLPCSHCTFIVFRYSTNYVVQIAVEIPSGNVFTRIVNLKTCQIYRGWKVIGENESVKILAVGDSICAGVRNEKKGFVGDLGFPYKNVGITGATISNKRTNVANIPDQLVQVSGYDPDVIIANGGVNDFYYGAELGKIPVSPVITNASAEALNRNTVMGGLQYLFYQMIALYPKAQRFFLLTHRTTANLNGTVVDWAITNNSAGYTQTELFEAIKKVCKLYGVKVIDVFGEGMINTAFGVYRSAVAYTTDKRVTNTEFVDKDGIHPLAYGYLHGYVPLVKQALQLGRCKKSE